MNLFGPPLAIHGPKKPLVVILVIVAVGAFWLAWLSLHQNGPDKSAGPYEAGPCLVIGILLATLALWLSQRRVILYSEGLSYETILGERQIRWDDLSRFYYQATKQSVNLIPVGTFYWFRLIDSQGQKIRFGSGLSQTEALANKLLELTQVPLLRKIATRFDSGTDIDFGPIRVNREHGISARSGWPVRRVKQIPWGEVSSYAIQDGQFYIWRVGEKWAAIGPAIAQIPNAFALLGLLDVIFKSPER